MGNHLTAIRLCFRVTNASQQINLPRDVFEIHSVGKPLQKIDDGFFIAHARKSNRRAPISKLRAGLNERVINTAVARLFSEHEFLRVQQRPRQVLQQGAAIFRLRQLARGFSQFRRTW